MPAARASLARAATSRLASALLGALVLLPACAPGPGPGAGPRAAGDTVAIGVALDPQRPGMESIYQGVELALAELNAAGGGPPLVLRRGPADVRSAVQIATALRDDPQVLAVVGHPESSASLEALPIYEDQEHGGEHAVAVISPTATSPELSGRSPWFFRVCPTDEAASRAVARYVRDSLGLRRAAVVYRNDAYGRDWTKAFVTAFQASGGQVVQRDPYLTGVAEWPAYAGYARHAGAEVFLFPGSVEDAELAIRALRAAGHPIPFIGGDAASGLEEQAAEFAGARYTAFFDANQATSAEARAFVAAFQGRFARQPDQRAALAYDAAMLAGRAVRELGDDASRTRVRDWLRAVGRSRPAHAGAAGPIAFDERHDVTDKPVVITTVGAR